MIYTSPLSLLVFINDNELIEEINKFLPYSTGFEIECFKNENLSDETIKNNFQSIPYIIEYDYSSNYEYRFRIPNGLKGLICLYLICEQLKSNLVMNLGSGIHYHVDCTDIKYDYRRILNFDLSTKELILSQLDKWEYKGNYNSRKIDTSGSWIKVNDLKTYEFRCGEMSFSYEHLVYRIIDANFITLFSKSLILNEKQKDLLNNIQFQTVDKQLILDYLKNINNITVNKKPENKFNRYSNIIKNRINI